MSDETMPQAAVSPAPVDDPDHPGRTGRTGDAGRPDRTDTRASSPTASRRCPTPTRRTGDGPPRPRRRRGSAVDATAASPAPAPAPGQPPTERPRLTPTPARTVTTTTSTTRSTSATTTPRLRPIGASPPTTSPTRRSRTPGLAHTARPHVGDSRPRRPTRAGASPDRRLAARTGDSRAGPTVARSATAANGEAGTAPKRRRRRGGRGRGRGEGANRAPRRRPRTGRATDRRTATGRPPASATTSCEPISVSATRRSPHSTTTCSNAAAVAPARVARPAATSCASTCSRAVTRTSRCWRAGAWSSTRWRRPPATSRSTATSTSAGCRTCCPGMEAAFVDIGTPKNGVLYRGDVAFDKNDIEGGNKPKIERMLKNGQMILVQVTKNPIAHKGARLTQEVSLAGRFLVMVPGEPDTYGISKRLPDDERKRLRRVLDGIRPDDAGLIVRTAAEGATTEELERDVRRLRNQWDQISELAAKSKSAKLALPGARPRAAADPRGVHQGVPRDRHRQPRALRGDPGLRRGDRAGARRPGRVLRHAPKRASRSSSGSTSRSSCSRRSTARSGSRRAARSSSSAPRRSP